VSEREREKDRQRSFEQGVVVCVGEGMFSSTLSPFEWILSSGRVKHKLFLRRPGDITRANTVCGKKKDGGREREREREIFLSRGF
jgi:hypothetical protein